MTTEQLRKEITVTNWSINSEGIAVYYFRSINNQSFSYLLNLNPEGCARQLSSIGSINSWSDEIIFSLNVDGYDMNWATFLLNFKLSQWEALTLVIRHELEKETEKEIADADIGKAIDSLTK